MSKKSPRKSVRGRLRVPFAVILLAWLGGFGIGYVYNNHPEPTIPVSQATSSVEFNANQAEVCFTPGRRCQSLILNHINLARETIQVQAYSFTDTQVAQALTAAHQRGVNVQVLLDKSNSTNPKSAKYILISNKVPVRFDAPAGIAHNKIIIVDHKTVLTGSYNYSTGAWKRNTENLLVFHNASLAKDYTQNWQKRWGTSSCAVNNNVLDPMHKRGKRSLKVPH